MVRMFVQLPRVLYDKGDTLKTHYLIILYFLMNDIEENSVYIHDA